MFKKILVAYDGSEPADNAFECARLFGRNFGATIDVISVVHRSLIGDDVQLTAEINDGIRRAEKAVFQLRRRAHGDKTEFQFLTVVGQPAEKIVARANNIEADLIVMGCRGISAIERWLTGSTVRQVMGHSMRPMLIVP
jgi:nucleotide-binding universal stress UspA family protein